jgi:hypothetical protein
VRGRLTGSLRIPALNLADRFIRRYGFFQCFHEVVFHYSCTQTTIAFGLGCRRSLVVDRPFVAPDMLWVCMFGVGQDVPDDILMSR